MILRVDPSSALPPYEQIRAQITALAATGAAPIGTRLPSIRQLAADLGIAAGTVGRAYRELEQDGVISTRGRHGTFLIGTGTTADSNGAGEALAEAAETFAASVATLGVSPGLALDVARRALDEVTPGA